MFEELEVVKLKYDLPEHDMKAGTIGTIVMVHIEPYRAYEVELDDEGASAVVTLRDEELLAVSGEDIEALRQRQAAWNYETENL